MKTLHDVAVYWSPMAKKWVIKHTSVQKPFTNRTVVSKQRMFLSRTGLKVVRDQINLVLT